MCCTNAPIFPRTTSNSNVRISNLSQCEGVTVSLLNQWNKKLKSMKANGSWNRISKTENDVDEMITLINNWVIAKNADPATCEYFDQLQTLQTFISLIIKEGL